MSDSEELTILVKKPKKIIKRNKIIIKTKTEEEKKKEDIEKKKEEIKKRQQRENILKSMSDKEEFLQLEGRCFIYPNQQEAADKCIEAYKNGAVAVCLIAQPGTGKTGTAQAVMISMATNTNDDEIIYAENIINCTGMSDNDWENQFKNSVLQVFTENIFHRQNLIKQTDKLRNLKNGLIIPDECHIASGSKMTIAKTLKEAGILDVNVLEMRNIKMLDISATPDAVLQDYKKWGKKCAIVKIQPGPLYKGFEVMLKENRIIDAPNLEEEDDYYEFLEFLDASTRGIIR
jgi:superfamily II DNA or RNA helicase